MKLRRLIETVSQQQAETLVERALHMLFRLAGYDFVPHERFMLTWASQGYVAKGWWAEALDIAINQADLMVNTARDETLIRDSFLCLSDALASSKQYQLAADVCVQLARIPVDDIDDQFVMYGHAVTTYLTAGSLDDAEETLIWAFCDISNRLMGKLNDKKMIADFLQLGIMLYAMRAHADHTELGDEWTTSKSVSYLLLVLQELITGNKRTLISLDSRILNKKLRKGNAAISAVCQAFQAASAQTTEEASMEAFRSGFAHGCTAAAVSKG